MIEKTKADKLDMKDELFFHTTIAEASYNPIVQRLIPTISNTNFETRERYSSHRKAALAHRRVFDALENKNPDLAQGMMRKHLEGTLRELKKIVRNKQKNLDLGDFVPCNREDKYAEKKNPHWHRRIGIRSFLSFRCGLQNLWS